ncbi:hypothetical protein ACZ91_24725 [Streptomyces regensis]|nr:hypothetical protein ACZ91_24725 [Streptomyces regensis]
MHQQTLVSQEPERLAQRVAGHRERLARAVLRQPGAGTQSAVDDQLAQCVGDPLGGTRAVEESVVLGEQVGPRIVPVVRSGSGHRWTSPSVSGWYAQGNKQIALLSDC